MVGSQDLLRFLAQSASGVVCLSLADSTSTHIHLIIALASVGAFPVVALSCVFGRNMAVAGCGSGRSPVFPVAAAARTP